MGKYMRKNKLSPQLSLMEISTSTLGVRTRARTLAIQRFEEEIKKQSGSEIKNLCSSGLRGLSSGSVGSAQVGRVVELEDCGDGFEGENDLGFEPTVRAADNISTPGSSTRYPNLAAKDQRPLTSILTNIPTTRDMDELFTHFEQQQQRLFMDKYNFDIINDTPLPGRYEWRPICNQ